MGLGAALAAAAAEGAVYRTWHSKCRGGGEATARPFVTIARGEPMIIATALLAVAFAAPQSPAASPAPSAPTVSGPIVVLETSMGNIRIALDEQKAPITVKNFLAYVRAGHYDGTIFHRVIPRFMVQGGG